ncbi:MAG: hypothetical protein A2X36_04055 [Elusimicrobia bacterium GWA2_69_24]|nr:MAG: hypothetical protein A2X36_04055 [Elusimicrobia bacterium GWA2_69_24]HBL16048.1 hypothetical protein [Elusimicrobiota bacterium]
MSAPETAASAVRRVREFRQHVLRRRERRDGAGIWERKTLADVRKVVLILSAPRSGSSLLYALLKRLPQVYSLSGECVPFYKLNGLASDLFPSDAIPSGERGAPQRKGLSRDLLSDCGVAGAGKDRSDWGERFIDELALRLPLQWPRTRFTYEGIRRAAQDALAAHRKDSPMFRKEAFHLELLSRLRTEHPEIDPYYYDLPAEAVARRFPGLPVPLGPPNDVLTIEEPPFILIEPRREILPQDLDDRTLLLKSTVNAFRVDYIRSLFPNADLRAVYLTRNPLASINGLCDGWLYRGFFSHQLRAVLEAGPEKRLRIAGYSDRHPWGRWWWNFELPEGWRDYAGRRLEEVCAFQWLTANRAVQEALKTFSIPSVGLRFEELTDGIAARSGALRKVCRFMGGDFNALEGTDLEHLPVVQATRPPDAARWKLRHAAFLPLSRDPRMREMSWAMGYGTDLETLSRTPGAPEERSA